VVACLLYELGFVRGAVVERVGLHLQSAGGVEVQVDEMYRFSSAICFHVAEELTTSR
jgi:hypothetical protein